MTCSRKEFLRTGLLFYGRTLLETLSGGETSPSHPSLQEGPVRIDARRCLARVSGCFACIDHCHGEAIRLDRAGLSVDGTRCDRCGVCTTVCPLIPSAITLSADEPDPSHEKGGRV